MDLKPRDIGCEGKGSGCCSLLKEQLWEGGAGRLGSGRGSREPGEPGGHTGPSTGVDAGAGARSGQGKGGPCCLPQQHSLPFPRGLSSPPLAKSPFLPWQLIF